jgi:selenocysteine-specific elongation factor
VNYVTVGTAGHINHGKTSLIKCLTNIETDRLPEEKKRGITIELGFAPLCIGDYQFTFVDVPGHEKFTRKMVAGIYSTDLVLLIIDVNEGIKPQTIEHAQILSLLNKEDVIIVLTKIDRASKIRISNVHELIQKEIIDGIGIYIHEIIEVDSLTGIGISQLKETILNISKSISNFNVKNKFFRMAIDQVFTLKGYGTIVRGPILTGTIFKGNRVYLWPSQNEVRVKGVQVNQLSCANASKGQRAALNISHSSKIQPKQGDILTTNNKHPHSYYIDVSIKVIPHLKHRIHNRSFIKVLHCTSELIGKIILLDRDCITGGESLVCQIHLSNPHHFIRGDKLIIRLPSPPMTIGGCSVINPLGEKYKNKKLAKDHLEVLARDIPIERLNQIIYKKQLINESYVKDLMLVDDEINESLLNKLIEDGQIIKKDGLLTTKQIYNEALINITNIITNYTLQNPNNVGISKVQCFKNLKVKIPYGLFNFIISDQKSGIETYLDSLYFGNAYESNKLLKGSIDNAIRKLKDDGIQVQQLELYLLGENISQNLIPVIIRKLTSELLIVHLFNKHYIHNEVLLKNMEALLINYRNGFTLSNAKALLGVSRKYLIPFLELLDRNNYTIFTNEKRYWSQQ